MVSQRAQGNVKSNKVIYSKAEMEKLVLVISLQPDSEGRGDVGCQQCCLALSPSGDPCALFIELIKQRDEFAHPPLFYVVVMWKRLPWKSSI